MQSVAKFPLKYLSNSSLPAPVCFVLGMAAASSGEVPRKLAGPDWLYIATARHEAKRPREWTPPEYDERMAAVAKRTVLGQPKAEGAGQWQSELQDRLVAASSAGAFCPNRMVFYSSGRPCVAASRYSLGSIVGCTGRVHSHSSIVKSLPPHRTAQFVHLASSSQHRAKAISKALCITHELSAVHNRDVHLTEAFRPYPLYYILGRTAAAQPTCPAAQCLWFTWRDTLSNTRNPVLTVMCFSPVSASPSTTSSDITTQATSATYGLSLATLFTPTANTSSWKGWLLTSSTANVVTPTLTVRATARMSS